MRLPTTTRSGVAHVSTDLASRSWSVSAVQNDLGGRINVGVPVLLDRQMRVPKCAGVELAGIAPMCRSGRTSGPRKGRDSAWPSGPSVGTPGWPSVGRCHDPQYRRAIHRLLGRGESRNSLARDLFHGRRGQLRQHYQTGQENQLGALSLMVNVIVLWQTVYTQAALDHLDASGQDIDPADVARLSPLGHPTINLHGRYRTTSRAPAGRLRPLRTAD